jgi:Cof subfamily protein (haloacid dehalogenase superfamily)/HAD superfamily hydrolase (TIGR01509 family)
MIQSVIFDMDGVLIDSEPVYQDYIYEGLRFRYPWVKREDLYPMAGMNSTEDKIFLAKLTRRDAADPDFLEEVRQIYDTCKVYYPDIMREQVPGVLSALKEMGLKLALASSSSIKTITKVLEECGIGKYFDVVVSGDEFHESKPNPEIYIHTMQRLGCRSEECLIVEDSTYGIAAGTDAGVKVAAVRDARFPFDQSRAQFRIDSLEEVLGLVRRDAREIKAAFFDVDDTLVDRNSHRMPDSTRRALCRLREKGIPVLLSTGRHVLEIEQENILPGVAYDGAVWLNGQLCELNSRVVLEKYIPARQLGILGEFLETRHCSCIFLEKDSMYCNFVGEEMRKEQEKIGTAVPKIRSMEGLEERKVCQAIPFINEEEERELSELLPDCRMTRWGSEVVDLIAGEGGKEQGIRVLCEELGIRPEETIAFGDGENDVDMLRLAGIGVAMGNARDSVKEAADYVTGDMNGDGIENALVYFGVI